MDRKWMRALLPVVVLTGLFTAAAIPLPAAPRRARNVILMIGDGMGLASLAHAHYYQLGAETSPPFRHLAMESLPVTGLAYTHCANSLVTDSAAAATALWTGRKTNRGYLAMDPGGHPLRTLLEEAAAAGKATGLVTSVPITHATPAAAYAHLGARSNYPEVFRQLLARRPDVVLGAGADSKWHYLPHDFEKQATAAGYTVCRKLTDLRQAGPAPVLGVFGTDMLTAEWDRRLTPTADPHLSDLTGVALDRLSASPDGFLLMVEGGTIDWANHDNSLEKSVCEVLEFDRSVALVIEWIKAHGSWEDTLLVVTADHETGELAVRNPKKGFNGKTPLPAGTFAKANYASGDHSACPVPVFAAGPGSGRLSGCRDNTEIHGAMRDSLLGIGSGDPTPAEPR